MRRQTPPFAIRRVPWIGGAAGLLLALVACAAQADSVATNSTPWGPGDHTQSLAVGGLTRTYLVHVPPRYDPARATPVVLALHGAGMNGPMMSWFTDLNQAADQQGFIAVYPSGTGTGLFLTWNAGGFSGRRAKGKPDDVAFIRALLDDLPGRVHVDRKRIYACGMSNGAMMCYRLAAEMSDRIAAIAPVAGTLAIEESRPVRPVPVMHFHGTRDTFVPFERPEGRAPAFMKLKSVEETIRTWVRLNGCREVPESDVISKEGDRLKVTRARYGGGRDGAEVILVSIDGGGHTWPGKEPPVGFIGESTASVSANQMMWEFFRRHRLP